MGFQSYNDRWHQQLHQIVEKLKRTTRPPTTDEETNHLLDLVQTFLSHLTDYYRVKSVMAHQDVLFLLDAPWATTFERSLHWIGGWRPCTAFQVVHTESTILFENRLLDIINGGSPNGDLGDLTPEQFKSLSDLHSEINREENDLSDLLSHWQDSATDAMLLRYEEGIDKEIVELGEVVRKADELRMKTIGKVVQVLSPQQTVDFLISAAELHSFIRGWGERRDDYQSAGIYI